MTEAQKLDFARRSAKPTAPTTPVKVLPKFSESLKFKNPAYQAGLEELDAKMEEWRKSLNFGK